MKKIVEMDSSDINDSLFLRKLVLIFMKGLSN